MSGGGKVDRLEKAFRVLGETPVKPVPSTISEQIADRLEAPVASKRSEKSGHEPVIEQPEPAEPTKRLADIDPDERGVPYAEWKADQLNAIWAQHGTGGPAHITARVVAHGQEKENSTVNEKGDNPEWP